MLSKDHWLILPQIVRACPLTMLGKKKKKKQKKHTQRTNNCFFKPDFDPTHLNPEVVNNNNYKNQF
jgi:hypothetical protein